MLNGFSALVQDLRPSGQSFSHFLQYRFILIARHLPVAMLRARGFKWTSTTDLLCSIDNGVNPFSNLVPTAPSQLLAGWTTIQVRLGVKLESLLGKQPISYGGTPPWLRYVRNNSSRFTGLNVFDFEIALVCNGIDVSLRLRLLASGYRGLRKQAKIGNVVVDLCLGYQFMLCVNGCLNVVPNADTAARMHCSRIRISQ